MSTCNFAGFLLITWVLSLSEPVAVVCAEKSPRPEKKPNIVFILADDLGWSDLGCYGHPYHRTPNLNRLASQGMRFTNGYAPAPICSASRASILTGKAVARLGFEFVTKNDPGTQQIDMPVPLSTPPLTLNLPLSEKTIAEYMADLNYQTVFFGKWHVSQHYERRYLAWHPRFGPPQQGFEFAVEDFGDHPYAWKNKQPENMEPQQFPTDSMIEKTAEFIRRRHDRPYFLMASSFYVHTPVKNRTAWLVAEYEKHLEKGARNRKRRLEYAAFVETLDHYVGIIMNAIDESGQGEDTLVCFMSDNGGHPEYCSNAPLRGSKWNLYEGGIRVPFLFRRTGHIQANSECDVPVIGYDLLSTFVALGGGNATGVDGDNLQPLWTDPTLQFERSLIWHFPYYHPEKTYSKAIDKIGISDFTVSKTHPQSALRRGKYKLLKFAEDQQSELYDLNEDLSEQHDLSGKLPLISREFNDSLDQQLNAMHARRAVPHQQ